MKHFIFILLSIMLLTNILYAEIIEETGSFAGFVYGRERACEYDNWILHLTKKIQRAGYNVYAPFVRNGINFPFGTYYTPTNDELEAWGEVCQYFINEDFTTADEMIEDYGFPYQIVRFNDTDTGRLYFILREMLNMTLTDDQGTPETTDDVVGGFDYSWGIYVVRPDAPLPIILTFVHPGDDYPVPPLLVKAFTEWDAKYMMMAGASREASWTQQGNFVNDSSLSDPSRNPDHPYNRFYTQACEEIRSTFDCFEYSVQLHSYDWASNTHFGASNIQISAGNGQNYPSLPIRDHSSRKRDIVNTTAYLVYPANSIGTHDPVYVTDYYTVYYDRALMPFYFDDGEHHVPVTNYVTLPGAATNVQFLHTTEGHGKYEVTNRFLHAELDELPYCYPQTENYWKWFYGYDITTGTYDMANRFARSLEYYSPFIENLGVVIREMLALDDGLPVATPADFAVLSLESSIINLGWTEVDCYDFDTYEILYSTLEGSEVLTRDRADEPRLATAKTTSYALNDLDPGETYLVSIRAKDHNGNISASSPPLTVPLGGLADIVYDATTPILSLDCSVTLRWRGDNQSTTMLGYKIYRTTIGGTPEVIASHENVNSLRRTSASQSYVYTDNTAENFIDYEYFLATCSATNEYPQSTRLLASPRPMYVLYLMNTANTVSDYTTVGFSPFANDGVDNSPAYDVANQATPNHMIRAHQPNWWIGNVQGVRLSREVKQDFDMTNGYKSFNIRLRSDQGNVKITLGDLDPERPEKVIIADENGVLNINLRERDYAFTAQPNNAYTDLFVHIGNVRPVPVVSNAQEACNLIYRPGDDLAFDFSTQFSSLLDHFVVKFVNATDQLIINSNVSADAGSVNYIIPAGVTMHDASAVFEAHCTDGEIFEYTIASEIGILPTMITISFPANPSFVANPFPYVPLVLSNLGIVGNLYNLTSQYWEADTQIDFLKGYLLKATEEFSQTFGSDIRKTRVSITASPGWNLIANPHLQDFDIADLSISIGSNLYLYAELLQDNVLLPYVRVLRDGILADTDHVKALESFLLYVNASQNVSIVFIPYKNNPPITPGYYVWQTGINAHYQDDVTVSDAVVVSVVDGIPKPNSNIAQHSPKSVTLPGGMNFYLKETPTDTSKYHSRTIAKMSEEEVHYTAIPFTLEIPALQPLVFESFETVDGLQYSVKIAISGTEYELPCLFTPTDLVINGEIHIANENLSPVTDTVITPLVLSVYPNPFNPTTNIAFNLPKDAFVECAVYNIKGQRVKTLARERMNSGNHILRWNGVDTSGRSVGSGIYFVTINPQGQSRVVKKVTLLK